MTQLISLPFAFSSLPLCDYDTETSVKNLRDCMAAPPRFYHTEAHIRAVLTGVWRWTNGSPSAPLLIAALYHDAVYDATRTDNEERSANFCRAEMTRLQQPSEIITESIRLIRATATHDAPVPGDTDAILLLDADLFVLGAEPGEYAAYGEGVRAEYAHVPPDVWRTGRGRVLDGFLARPHIYHGDWHGVAEREAVARFNIESERDSLAGIEPA